MTTAERKVRQYELDVKIAETKLREAQRAMEHGFAKAKAEFERECDKLKGDVERAALEVQKEEAFLAESKAELERGFEA